MTNTRLKTAIKGFYVLGVTLRLLLVRKQARRFSLGSCTKTPSFDGKCASPMIMVNAIYHSVVDLKFFSDYFTQRGC